MLFQKFHYLNVYLEILKIEFVLFDLVYKEVIRYGIKEHVTHYISSKQDEIKLFEIFFYQIRVRVFIT